jgi:hypothetical protein
MGETINLYKMLAGKYGEIPIGKLRRRWDDNIKIGLYLT